jgi:hypothetical protein
MEPPRQAQLLELGEYTTPEGVRLRFNTIAPGAATSVLVATSPQLKHLGERYLEDCNDAAVLAGENLDGHAVAVAAYAVDSDNARRLWELFGTDVV